MEQPISISVLKSNTGNADILQQSLHSNGHHFNVSHNEVTSSIKLIETENKLARVFEEYTGRIESFMLMLDTLKEGVVILNRQNEICYTNELGSTLIKEWNIINPRDLSYRDIETEDNAVMHIDTDCDLHIRTNNFFWNGEQCNLFVLEKKEAGKKDASVIAPHTNSSINGQFDALLNYVQLIATHERNSNPDETAAYTALADKTILQSEALLRDIKTFIGLANYKPVVTQVAMQKVVGDVLKAMGPEIEDAEIEISVSELPETKADKELIIKLIKHLVSNALKFRNKNRKAIIDIGHDKSEGQYIFCVRDNGLGISKKHHEEIFNLFTTLNDMEPYPGHGIGLAICKKIVALHDGKIWVESLPGHGSNFYFKLNAK